MKKLQFAQKRPEIREARRDVSERSKRAVRIQQTVKTHMALVYDDTGLVLPGFCCSQGLLGDSVFVAVSGDI